jgi:FixJ family two-component response regulator
MIETPNQPGEDGAPPIVFIVDDDESIRRGLSSILRSVGLNVRMFGSAGDFLSTPLPETPSCLVLDIRLPGMSGLTLQEQIAKRKHPTPIIVITGHGDVPMSVRALKAGAVDFLTKPFRDQDVIDAVSQAIETDRLRRHNARATQILVARHASLTGREREIFKLVCSGLMNKQIAAEIGLSEITVKIHRGQVMKKMSAQSLPDLVRMGEALRSQL